MKYAAFYKALRDNALPNVLLFCGEEEYIKGEAYSALQNKLLPENRDLNLTIFDSAGAQDIINACETLPFMADTRLVLCRFLPKEKDAKQLSDYFKRIPPQTCLVFYVSGAASATLGIVKAVKAMDGIAEFDMLSEQDAVRWVIKESAARSAPLDTQLATFFVQSVGSDMLSIKNELGKLTEYVLAGNAPSRSVISHVVIKNIEYKIFTMFDYFVNGKISDGFRAYESLAEGKSVDDEARSAAVYFTSCFKNMLGAADAVAAGAPMAEIMARSNSRSEFVAKKVCANAKKFSREQLLKAILDFSDASRLRIDGSSSDAAFKACIFKHFQK